MCVFIQVLCVLSAPIICAGFTWTVHLAVRRRRCLTTTSVFVLRVELESHRSPACCRPCCKWRVQPVRRRFPSTRADQLWILITHSQSLYLLLSSTSSDGWTGFRLRRLYFVWVCRELQAFYWFAELLCALHTKVRMMFACQRRSTQPAMKPINTTHSIGCINQNIWKSKCGWVIEVQVTAAPYCQVCLLLWNTNKIKSKRLKHTKYLMCILYFIWIFRWSTDKVGLWFPVIFNWKISFSIPAYLPLVRSRNVLWILRGRETWEVKCINDHRWAVGMFAGAPVQLKSSNWGSNNCD